MGDVKKKKGERLLLSYRGEGKQHVFEEKKGTGENAIRQRERKKTSSRPSPYKKTKGV